jgi:hypothetical protein
VDFNVHSDLADKHAFLSPSKYHWINYSEEKLDATFLKHLATERGTRMHRLASELIGLGVKLPRSRKSLNMYVNDAIGYLMKPEVVLYYSPICFGTADSICFHDNTLRIHDLKTGVSAVSMSQLYVYAALFCLEYKMGPSSINIELRIYQGGEIEIETADVNEIERIISKIIAFDKRITQQLLEGGLDGYR